MERICSFNSPIGRSLPESKQGYQPHESDAHGSSASEQRSPGVSGILRFTGYYNLGDHKTKECSGYQARPANSGSHVHDFAAKVSGAHSSRASQDPANGSGPEILPGAPLNRIPGETGDKTILTRPDISLVDVFHHGTDLSPVVIKKPALLGSGTKAPQGDQKSYPSFFHTFVIY